MIQNFDIVEATGLVTISYPWHQSTVLGGTYFQVGRLVDTMLNVPCIASKIIVKHVSFRLASEYTL